MKRFYWPLYLAFPFLFMGCAAQQQFISTGPGQNLPPKQAQEVIVFSSPSQVPWPYIEIGELDYNKQPGTFQTPKVQIEDLKREAAKHGAAGVILHRSIGARGYQYEGTGQSQSFAFYSGTAIARKEPSSPLSAVK